MKRFVMVGALVAALAAGGMTGVYAAEPAVNENAPVTAGYHDYNGGWHRRRVPNNDYRDYGNAGGGDYYHHGGGHGGHFWR